MRLNECMFSTLGDFLQVDKWRILRSNAFVSNSVSNRENLLRRLFRCWNRLMERTVCAVRNVTSGTSVSNPPQIGKTFYGDFSDIGTGLWRGLFAPYAMSRVVPAFQIRQNVHRRRPQIWTAFHVNGRRSRWESASCDSWKSSPDSPCEVAEEVGICNKSSCRLILTDKRTMSRVAAKLVPASVDA